MEIGNIRPQRLTEKERCRLVASGACFKCRQRGHRANNCPTRFQNQPNAQPNQNQNNDQRRNLPPRPGVNV